MKSPKTLITMVIQDMGDLLEVAVERDLKTLHDRYHHEGLGFLTLTLPTYADGFLESIQLGRLDPSRFPSFGFRGRLPRFLGGFVRLVFDDGGLIRPDADEEGVRSVLQICNLFRKLEFPLTEDRLEKAQKAFIRTDAEIGRVPPSELSQLKRVFVRLFMPVLTELDSLVANFALIPRHGPGAVAERLSSKEKRESISWLESLESVFPSVLYGTYDGIQPPPVVPLDQEPPSRVTFVPKTMKGPRTIAIEPAARQFLQQGLARPLYRGLKRLYPAQLDLFDQRTNQAWAWWGSGTGEVATLDLSEASDRLSWDLVMGLIPEELPHLVDAMHASRSARCELNGKVITLSKFASMGSALTFPVQSMVFFAISVLGTSRHAENPLDRIAVYGDDIIVPTTAAADVVQLLETFGLKVNRRKSYVTGDYRESCGEEYFRGHSVKAVKVRRYFSSETSDSRTLASVREYRNQFYIRGMWRTARHLDRLCGRSMSATAPVDHPSIGRWSFLPSFKIRFNSRLQREEILVPILRPIGISAKPDGRGGILDFFYSKMRSGEAVSPYEAIERSPALAIHRGWTPLW